MLCFKCALNWRSVADTRVGFDEWFLRLAEVTAQRGTCTRASVGAVIARGNRLLVQGYVGSPPGQPHCLDVGCQIGPKGGCVATRHAEVNALDWADELKIDVRGATLYTTLSPCRDCAMAAYEAEVARIVYRTEYRLPAAIDWLRAAGIEVLHVPGVLAP